MRRSASDTRNYPRGLLVNAYPLLELLVYRVQRIFDSDSFQVSRRDLDTGRKNQINFLDRWSGEHLFEDARVVDAAGRGIDFPVRTDNTRSVLSFSLG